MRQSTSFILILILFISSCKEDTPQLTERKISHSLLHAKNITEEKNIINSSGKLGNITLATNVISRGTDISLGNIDTSNWTNNFYISKRQNLLYMSK